MKPDQKCHCGQWGKHDLTPECTLFSAFVMKVLAIQKNSTQCLYCGIYFEPDNMRDHVAFVHNVHEMR